MRGFPSYVRSDGIRLSTNGWEKAHHVMETIVSMKGKRSGLFWLYVVTEAESDQPGLHRIQHPVAQFREGEDIFATGFIVHEEAWRERVRNGG